MSDPSRRRRRRWARRPDRRPAAGRRRSRVTLLEGKPRLGGRPTPSTAATSSSTTASTSSCAAAPAISRLLDRLGVADLVTLEPPRRPRDRRRQRQHAPPAPNAAARSPAPRRRRCCATACSAPDNGSAWCGRPWRCAASTLRATPSTAPALATGCATHGQDARTVQAVWDLIGIATLNAKADDASLSLAATVFQIGLLTKAGNGDIGWSKVPLQQLHGDPAAAELSRLGAERPDQRQGRAHRADTRRLAGDLARWREPTFDAVVLAVPPAAAEQLLPAGPTDLPSGWAERLGDLADRQRPLVYDRKVLDEPFIAGLGTRRPGCSTAPTAWGSRPGRR